MNPKGKKTISLTVSDKLDLTGRELKQGLIQLVRLYLGLIEKKDMNTELIYKVRMAVL